MGAPEEVVVGVEQWDLTATVSPYLDRHMMFPLLEYLDTLIEKKIIAYSRQDVAAARLALLQPTHMVDYMMDVYKSLHGGSSEENTAVPAEMEERKQQIFQELEEFKKGCAPLDQLMRDEERRNKLVAHNQWNLNFILALSEPKITMEMVDTYRQWAKYYFDCGDYQTSRSMLSDYMSLLASPPPPQQQAPNGPNSAAPAMGGDEDDELAATAAGLPISATSDGHNLNSSGNNKEAVVGNPAIYYLTAVDNNIMSVLWGRLACDILVEDWEAASLAVEAVKTALEMLVQSHQITPLQALQQRTWLLHWSLFVYWNDVKGGLEHLVELFHSERFKQAITTNAPHLLRYLTAAVLLCKRRVTKKAASGSSAEARRLLRNLVNVMNDCEYSDPIVQFVHCVCVKFDFDLAQTKLAECEKVLAADFFLCHQTALFMEEARVFVFENYCRIHNKIDLRALGEKLAMDQDQAERWIVDLIRHADLDAKIDSTQGCVVMGGNPQTVYEQVMERTRDLNVRSATLTQNLNNLLNEVKKERSKRERTHRDED